MNKFRRNPIPKVPLPITYIGNIFIFCTVIGSCYYSYNKIMTKEDMANTAQTIKASIVLMEKIYDNSSKKYCFYGKDTVGNYKEFCINYQLLHQRDFDLILVGDTLIKDSLEMKIRIKRNAFLKEIPIWDGVDTK